MKVTRTAFTSMDEAFRHFTEHPRAGVFVLQMLHDDDCPALTTQRDVDCTPPCRPELYLIEPFADARDN